MSVMDRLHGHIASRADAPALGVIRIVVAGAALVKILALAGRFGRFADPLVLRMPYFGWMPAPERGILTVLFVVWAASAAAFLFGWRARTSGAVLAAAIAFALLLDQQLYSSHLYLLGLTCLLLVIADSGAYLSVDARQQGSRQTPEWPITLLKVQLSIVYGFAAIAKVNAAYLSGGVLAVSLRRTGALVVPDSWRVIEFMLPLALLSIFAELYLAFELWSAQHRRSAFVVGLGLHLVMVATVVATLELAIFGAVLLPIYLLFLQAPREGRLVIWDDECSFCRVWVRWFDRLDWLDAHRFVGSSDLGALVAAGVSRDEADHAIQLVGPNERESGFEAVRAILEVLPVSFLWAPLLRLPPIRRVGDRAYRAVAARRRCTVALQPPPAVRSTRDS